MSTEGNFFSLTPENIFHIVESEGYELTGHTMVLNSYENRVYDFKCEDNSHIIAKFYRPGRWNYDQINEEHSFLFDLEAEEIPVCAPRKFTDGTSIHDHDGIFYSIWPRTGGRSVDELTDDQLGILGRLIARIHNVGAGKDALHRMTFSSDLYCREPLDFLLKHDFIPSNLTARFERVVSGIALIYDETSQGIPIHRIHGDCHLGNLLNGTQGWFFLDFDDFLTGPAVQDIWMLAPDRDMEGQRQRSIIIDNYRLFRDFNDSWLSLTEILRAMRYLYYSYWIAKRWNDPAFQAAFPHFGTQGYWEEEVKDLEEQLAYIYSGIGFQEKVLEEPEELDNSDFFWDWEEK